MSVPTGLDLGMSSGSGSIPDLLVSSGSVLFSACKFPIHADFCIGSVATDNKPPFNPLGCFFCFIGFNHALSGHSAC